MGGAFLNVNPAVLCGFPGVCSYLLDVICILIS